MPGTEAPYGGALLTLVGDDRGVEVMTGVVIPGRRDAHAGVDVVQGTSLALLLSSDLEIPRRAGDRDLDVFAVTRSDGDGAAAYALDLARQMRTADVNAPRVELAVASLVSNTNVAADFDLRPCRLVPAGP